jgi:hypothetical protein
LDVEWNSLTPEEREAQKPETVQLATTGGEIGVIRLESTFCDVIERKNFTAKGALWLVFKHPNIILCGVAVKKDINLLYKHYPEELFGDRLTTVARQYHMIESGRGTGTLQRLTEIYCGGTLNTQLAQSKWSVPNLSNELIEYAAHDAFASVKVTTAVDKAVDIAKYIYRTPGRDDLEAGTPVCLLARHTNRIVAVANFHHVEEKLKFVRARNGKLSERLFKRNMVKLVRVFDKAAFTPSTVEARELSLWATLT